MEKGRRVQHPSIRWMAATLDGHRHQSDRRAGSSGVILGMATANFIGAAATDRRGPLPLDVAALR
jgi:hypothetical protein